MAAPSVLWELRGRTGTPLTCSLHAAVGSTFGITLRMGPETIYSADFARERDALHHSEFLFNDFRQEGWAEEFHGDPTH
jgi:hypothetical protein